MDGLLYDDAFGVEEALNETYYDDWGVVVRGTHRVNLSSVNEAAKIHRPLAQAIYSAPTLHFLSVRRKPCKYKYKTNKPKTETWLHIAEGFSRTWQFPNCIEAVDEKHIQIKCPPNSRSMYFNYKGTYSIVLLAVVDSD
ncbi:hypothetical protein MRX96_008863 [Rhipicephalus microplus]